MKKIKKILDLLGKFMLFNMVKEKIENYKRKKRFKKKIDELKKRDPFIYNH
jgi:hypothetical protein